MNRRIRCWWPRRPPPGNVGDVITPALLPKLGILTEWAPQEHAELIATGSIVRFARPGMTVWGSGAMRAKDAPDPGARYLAVRGPITRAIVRSRGGRCPGVYGDPALLLPQVHDAPVEQLQELGVVPHYVDADLVDAQRYHVISPLGADPLAVVDRIRACRRIVSSSLHGIIIAHAYGIPAAWVKLSDRLDGDGTKFADYAMSVHVSLAPWTDIKAAAKAVVLGHLDTGPLLNALEALR